MLHEKINISEIEELFKLLSMTLAPKSESEQQKARLLGECLVLLVDRLRGDGGCPWDQEQTHQTLTKFMTEEAAELVDAIESNNDKSFHEELGDVLFQVLLHSRIASERQAFDFISVSFALIKKMVSRHPHVFVDTQTKNKLTADDILKEWEQLKKNEKKSEPTSLKNLNVPLNLPALQRSEKIGFRTAKLKFDWSSPKEVEEKFYEELSEFKETLDTDTFARQEEEYGDLLFSLAQWGRHLNLDPEKCLRNANRKFEKRYALMISLIEKENLNWDAMTQAIKEHYWVKAKQLEKAREDL